MPTCVANLQKARQMWWPKTELGDHWKHLDPCSVQGVFIEPCYGFHKVFGGLESLFVKIMATLVVNPLSGVQNSLQVAIDPLIPCHLPNALSSQHPKSSLPALITPNSTCTDTTKDNSTKNSQETTLTPQIPLLARPRLHVHTLYWFATIPKQPKNICELNNVFWGFFNLKKTHVWLNPPA